MVCLNEAAPDIPLNPPAGEEKTRLRVTYRVDESRWLRVTVHDLQRKINLMMEQAVVEVR